MGFIDTLRGVINKMFGREEVTKRFGVSTDMSAEMYSALREWSDMFQKSVSSMPSVVAGEAARLATIDMSITVDGDGERARLIQGTLDRNRDRLRSKLELGCAFGGLIMKPTADGGIDFVPANRYIPISYDSNGNLDGVIFIDSFTKGNAHYTRLEFHRFVVDGSGNRVYIVSNKAYKSQMKQNVGNEVSLSSVEKWQSLQPEVVIEGISKPLFGYFRMPQANNIDIDSPLGVSIFSKATKSIQDFDVMYQKFMREVKLSDKIVFVDEQAMMLQGDGYKRAQSMNPFPELIRGLRFGNNSTKCIEEYNPSMRINEYKLAMQTQLDLISVQCGFSSGYFSFDEKTGAVTATQVESDDQRTYSTCTDIQQNYKQALGDLIDALDVFMTLYDVAPAEELSVSYYMRDLYVNVSEDRSRAFELSQNGYIPKWKYLMDYEGYSEAEAKKMVAEADDTKMGTGDTKQ